MNFPQTVSTTLFAGTISVGTTYAVVMKVPTDAQGGQITVLSAGVSSRAAIAAGSSPDFSLVTLSTAAAVNGTIATFASGAFTAGTPKAATIADADAGDATYFIAFKVMGTAANVDNNHVTGWFNYVPGI